MLELHRRPGVHAARQPSAVLLPRGVLSLRDFYNSRTSLDTVLSSTPPEFTPQFSPPTIVLRSGISLRTRSVR
jgi:hypothetical protein